MPEICKYKKPLLLCREKKSFISTVKRNQHYQNPGHWIQLNFSNLTIQIPTLEIHHVFVYLDAFSLFAMCRGVCFPPFDGQGNF